MSMYLGCCVAQMKMGAAARPNPLNPQVIPLLLLPPDQPANLCQNFLCKTFLFFPLSLSFSSCLRRLATTGPTVFHLFLGAAPT